MPPPNTHTFKSAATSQLLLNRTERGPLHITFPDLSMLDPKDRFIWLVWKQAFVLGEWQSQSRTEPESVWKGPYQQTSCVHTATYCIGLCTYASMLGHGTMLLMWKLKSRELRLNVVALKNLTTPTCMSRVGFYKSKRFSYFGFLSSCDSFHHLYLMDSQLHPTETGKWLTCLWLHSLRAACRPPAADHSRSVASYQLRHAPTRTHTKTNTHIHTEEVKIRHWQHFSWTKFFRSIISVILGPAVLLYDSTLAAF